MDEIVILSAVRTPIGSFQGELASVSAPALGAAALRAAIARAGVAPGDVEQVYMGCILTAGLGQAPARQAALARRLPRLHRRRHPQQGVRLGDAGGDDRRQRPALRRLPGRRRRRHGEHEPGALPGAGRPRRPPPRPRQADRLDDPRRPVGRLQRQAHGQLRRDLRRRVPVRAARSRTPSPPRATGGPAGRSRTAPSPARSRRSRSPQRKGDPKIVERDEEPFRSTWPRCGAQARPSRRTAR